MPPGVDPEAVIKHCIAAVRQKTLRDWVLAANLAVVIVLVVVGGLGLGLRFGLGPLELGLVVLLATVGYWLAMRPGKALGGVRIFVAVLFVFVGGLGVLLGFLVAWATVAYDLWSSTYGIVKKRLGPSTFNPADAPPVTNSELARRTDDIVARNGGNLTVHSDFLPFAGSGTHVGGWSFVVDLRKGKEDSLTGRRREPEPVEPLDLYAEVERSLLEFGTSNLTIEDRVFVSGTDIRDDRALLPSLLGRPSSSVSDAELRRLMVAPTHRVRHYKCIRVIDWRGELVLSLFVRFAVMNGRLFCELSRVLLTPLKPELHRIDGFASRPELRDLLWLVRCSFMSTLPLWRRSPAVVLRPVLRHQRRANACKLVKRNAFFDYGAVVSVLDRACSEEYSRYFQRLDHDMHETVLEHAILDTVVQVLDDHNIEIAEIAERRSTIINQGILVGGAFNAENVAVGAGAQVNQHSTPVQPAANSDSDGSKRNA